MLHLRLCKVTDQNFLLRFVVLCGLLGEKLGKTFFVVGKVFRKPLKFHFYDRCNRIRMDIMTFWASSAVVFDVIGTAEIVDKLRMLPDLMSPTIIVVDDRLDLESQITAQFHSSDVANLEPASSIEQLNMMLKQDIRKIIITTIFRFGDAAPNLNMRNNIILLVDECTKLRKATAA